MREVRVGYFPDPCSATISPSFQRNIGSLSRVKETRAPILLQCSSKVRLLPFADLRFEGDNEMMHCNNNVPKQP
jgi:hypothetical protein